MNLLRRPTIRLKTTAEARSNMLVGQDYEEVKRVIDIGITAFNDRL